MAGELPVKEWEVDQRVMAEIEDKMEAYMKWEYLRDHLYLETIMEMKPKSDDQYIGNEYFIG